MIDTERDSETVGYKQTENYQAGKGDKRKGIVFEFLIKFPRSMA